MVTQAEFKKHYEDLYKNGAIYVWGGNCEIITKELTDRLYRIFGSTKYNKAYYDKKLKEGKGKIGADCSGSIFPLSKGDKTAKQYYHACPIQGDINDLPMDTACLVFNDGWTHVGAYLGNGTTIEMASSKGNCVKQNFKKARWKYFGIPDWLETNIKTPITPSKPAPVTPSQPSTEMYRVRKSWQDAKSQIGAYKNLDYAKKACKTGYCVFDSKGNVVYPVPSKDVVIVNIQKWCNSYANTKIAVDGKFGPETKKALCKALQHCLNVKYKAGLIEDGSFGALTKKACKSASSARELTYICQAMLYCKGYNMKHSLKNNDLDKSYGSGTKATVLKYQQDTRGLRHDSKCGPATFYAMFNS